MQMLSSNYGWWQNHQGWVDAYQLRKAQRDGMVASYRETTRRHKSAVNSFMRLSRFEQVKQLRATGEMTDRYSTRAQRELASEKYPAARPTFGDVRPFIEQLLEQAHQADDHAIDALTEDADGISVGEQEQDELRHEALRLYREVEAWLADYAFEADTTQSTYVDPRSDDEIDEEREQLDIYAEALEDVSAASFDVLMEHRLYGRPSGMTSFVREAIRDGWACVPDYNDAVDNPVMVASDRGLMTALDAESQPVYRRLQDRDAANLFRTVQAHRRNLEAWVLDIEVKGEEIPVHPVFEVNADDLPRLRQGWLEAKQADDHESMVIFERIGRLAAPVYRERSEQRAEIASVQQVTIGHC